MPLRMLKLSIILYILYLVIPGATHAATLSGKPLSCFAYGPSCTISSFTVASATDIVLCGADGLDAPSSSCSCTGGTPTAFTGAVTLAGWSFTALSGCTVGTNPIAVSAPGASALTAKAEDITGAPLLDVFSAVQGALSTHVITTAPNEYCASWIVDGAGNGGTPQTPSAPFVVEGSPVAAFPENYADATVANAGTVTATWTQHVSSPSQIVALACFKPAAPIALFKACDATGGCLTLFNSGNSITVYIISSSGVATPLGTGSFNLVPAP